MHACQLIVLALDILQYAPVIRKKVIGLFRLTRMYSTLLYSLVPCRATAATDFHRWGTVCGRERAGGARSGTRSPAELERRKQRPPQGTGNRTAGAIIPLLTPFRAMQRSVMGEMRHGRRKYHKRVVEAKHNDILNPLLVVVGYRMRRRPVGCSVVGEYQSFDALRRILWDTTLTGNNVDVLCGVAVRAGAFGESAPC